MILIASGSLTADIFTWHSILYQQLLLIWFRFIFFKEYKWRKKGKCLARGKEISSRANMTRGLVCRSNMSKSFCDEKEFYDTAITPANWPKYDRATPIDRQPLTPSWRRFPTHSLQLVIGLLSSSFVNPCLFFPFVALFYFFSNAATLCASSAI